MDLEGRGDQMVIIRNFTLYTNSKLHVLRLLPPSSVRIMRALLVCGYLCYTHTLTISTVVTTTTTNTAY